MLVGSSKWLSICFSSLTLLVFNLFIGFVLYAFNQLLFLEPFDTALDEIVESQIVEANNTEHVIIWKNYESGFKSIKPLTFLPRFIFSLILENLIVFVSFIKSRRKSSWPCRESTCLLNFLWEISWFSISQLFQIMKNWGNPREI